MGGLDRQRARCWLIPCLAEVGDFNREIELTRQNRALMKLLDARARQTETVSFEDVKGLLGLAVRGKSPGTDSRATG